MAYPPEPWALAGRMDVSTFLVPAADLPVAASTLPTGHRPLGVGGRVPVGAAWVDYAPGGQLSYRELLVAVLVRRGIAVRPHITSIWVDSPSSRDGGRELWGIPKDLATFHGGAWSPRADDAGRTRATGATDSAADGAPDLFGATPHDVGRPVARAVVRRRRALPGRLPVRFAVAQHPYGAGPGAPALVSPVSSRSPVGAATLRWEFDPDGELGFLAGRRPVASVTLHDFAMSFGATAQTRSRARR